MKSTSCFFTMIVIVNLIDSIFNVIFGFVYEISSCQFLCANGLLIIVIKPNNELTPWTFFCIHLYTTLHTND